MIEPREVVRLSTPVAGIVSDVAVDRGDVVAAGDPIARLDSRVEEIQRDLAATRAQDQSGILGLEARIAFLTEQADRTETLAKRNAVSDTTAREAALEAEVARQELAEARVAHVLAGLELTQAEELLRQKQLVSPVAGVVTERLLNPGEYRDGQAHIATIARIDILRVEAFAPIAYFPHVQLGQQVLVTPEAPLDTPRTATIRVIDRVFDAATATFGLRMEIENADLSLPAGLRCTLSFP
nr:efflux RND transporter periplasmic adaptor subunit [Thetidibacter halocola]